VDDVTVAEHRRPRKAGRPAEDAFEGLDDDLLLAVDRVAVERDLALGLADADEHAVPVLRLAWDVRTSRPAG